MNHDIEGFIFQRVIKKVSGGELCIYTDKESKTSYFVRILKISSIMHHETAISTTPNSGSHILRSDYERYCRQRDIFQEFPNLPFNYVFKFIEKPEIDHIYILTTEFKESPVMRWICQYNRFLTPLETEYSETRARKIILCVIAQLKIRKVNIKTKFTKIGLSTVV